MNWQDVADEARIMEELDLNPKRDLEIAFLKSEKGFLEFLQLILDLDFKQRICSLEYNDENCDGLKARQSILERHIERMKTDANKRRK